jgi:hypothetical protein
MSNILYERKKNRSRLRENSDEELPKVIFVGCKALQKMTPENCKGTARVQSGQNHPHPQGFAVPIYCKYIFIQIGANIIHNNAQSNNTIPFIFFILSIVKGTFLRKKLLYNRFGPN